MLKLNHGQICFNLQWERPSLLSRGCRKEKQLPDRLVNATIEPIMCCGLEKQYVLDVLQTCRPQYARNRQMWNAECQLYRMATYLFFPAAPLQELKEIFARGSAVKEKHLDILEL